MATVEAYDAFVYVIASQTRVEGIGEILKETEGMESEGEMEGENLG